MNIKGGFRIRPSPLDQEPRKVVFSTETPEADWFGMVLNLVKGARLHVPQGSFEVLNDRPDMAPFQRKKQTQPAAARMYRLLDGIGTEVASIPGTVASVQQLSPGADFRLKVEFSQPAGDWGAARTSTDLVLKWTTPAITSNSGQTETDTSGTAMAISFLLFPGFVHRTVLPRFTLSPDAEIGHEFDMVVTVENAQAGWAWTDTLHFAVVPNTPSLRVVWDVPPLDGGAAVAVIADRVATVRATVADDVEAADILVVRRGRELESVVELPMVRDPGAVSAFAAEIEFPDIALYNLYLRLHRADGTAPYNENPLYVWPGRTGDAAGLVFIGGRYADAEAHRMQQVVGRVLAAENMTPHVVDPAPEDGAIYRDLLRHYLGEGEVVIWMGDRLNEGAQDAFSTFLDAGGRLLILSAGLSASADAGAFLREQLHANIEEAMEAPRQRLLMNLVPCCQAQPRAFRADYVPVKPLETAAPALVDLANNAATGARHKRNDDGTVYLPLDWPKDSRYDSAIRHVIESSVRFLRHQNVGEVTLEAPQGERIGSANAVWMDRRFTVRARARGSVSKAELLAYSLVDMELLHDEDGQLFPMPRVGEQDGFALFEAEFLPPEQGDYAFLVRLYPVNESSFVASVGTTVSAVLPSDATNVLVYVPAAISSLSRESLVALIDSAMAEQGLSTATLRELNGELGSVALDRHLTGKQMVMWFGSASRRQQETLREFLHGGGQLLLITDELQGDEDGSSPLLGPLFTRAHPGKKRIDKALLMPDGAELRSLLRYKALIPTFPAVPAFATESGDIAGTFVNTATYRTVYLSFQIGHLTTPTQRTILEHSLALLDQGMGEQRASIKLDAQTTPTRVNVQRLGEIAPGLRVTNSGGTASDRFSLSYQILNGSDVIATGQVDEPSLPAFGSRNITLPLDAIEGEGRYRIVMQLATADTGWAEQLVHHFHVVDVADPFARADIGGVASRGNGTALFDYDGDGDLDAYLVRLGAPSVVLRNDGNGIWVEDADNAIGLAGGGRGVALGDYDGDGDLDVYAITEEANHLFRNDGDGSFAEMTAEASDDSTLAGLLADEGSGRSGGFFDADTDGDLDLYLVNDLGPNRLFLNGDGKFEDRATAMGAADAGNGRGLAIADYDRDGDPDLFVANTGQSSLLLNECNGFRDMAAAAGLQTPRGDVGAAFGDYDNDGDFDLFVASETNENRLYRNDVTTGSSVASTFAETSKIDTLNVGSRSVGAAFFDYDNDGDLDLITASVVVDVATELYHNTGSGLLGVGHLLGIQAPASGRGLSVGDVDDDGDLDLLVAGADSSRMFLNSSDGGNRLVVDLTGPALNHYGVGATVEAVTGERRQLRQVQSTLGYCSQIEPRAQFGMGRLGPADTIRVVWPDGAVSVAADVGARRVAFSHPEIEAAIAAAHYRRTTGSYRTFPILSIRGPRSATICRNHRP